MVGFKQGCFLAREIKGCWFGWCGVKHRSDLVTNGSIRVGGCWVVVATLSEGH